MRERTGNAPEAEAEVEVDFDSLRSSAISTGAWPSDPDGLRALANTFAQRFANCRRPSESRGLLGAYATFLAGARRDGFTIEQTWDASEQCWLAGNERPLFGGTISRAHRFFPARGAASKPKAARETDRGEAMDRAVEELNRKRAEARSA